MNESSGISSNASNRLNPYEVLAQQLGLNFTSEDVNGNSSSGEHSYNSLADSGFGFDSSALNSLTRSAEFPNQLSCPRSFEPPAHSSPLTDDVPRLNDIPQLQRQFATMQFFNDPRDDVPHVNVSRMLAMQRDRTTSATTSGKIPVAAFGSSRNRQVPSFLPLQTPRYIPNNLRGFQQPEEPSSGGVWNIDEVQSDIPCSMASSASTPVSCAPSVSFPNARRRTDSESVAFAGSIFRQNLENYQRMQALTEKLGADWVARAIGFANSDVDQPIHSTTSTTRPAYPIPRPRVSSGLASLDLAYGSRGFFVPPNVWSGRLPVRDMTQTVVYSCKVFLGGVPWDTTDEMLIDAFQPFSNVRVEWPVRDNAASPPRGYLYVVFEHEKQVKHMLSLCTRDPRDGGSYYFFLTSRRMRAKEVQIIPWIIADANYIPRNVPLPHHRLDAKRTVFVGALHGVINAEALFMIMSDIFGDVIYSGIDTDKYKYPIGSGRVTFGNFDAFMRAVKMGFIEVKTPKFTKKLQLDPYLEDSSCSKCITTQGPYFCRDLNCFRYYCRSCWFLDHPTGSVTGMHKVIMRSERNTVMRTTAENMF